jgi:hypothetical protein
MTAAVNWCHSQPFGSTGGAELGLGDGVGVGLGVGLEDALADDVGLVPGLPP